MPYKIRAQIRHLECCNRKHAYLQVNVILFTNVYKYEAQALYGGVNIRAARPSNYNITTPKISDHVEQRLLGAAELFYHRNRIIV